MKPMVWKHEDNDQRVNEYLDRTNHAPYELIFASVLGVFCLFTALVLLGVF